MVGPGQDYFFMVPLLGKILQEINRTGRDYSVPLGKVLSSTEFQLLHLIPHKLGSKVSSEKVA